MSRVLLLGGSDDDFTGAARHDVHRLAVDPRAHHVGGRVPGPHADHLAAHRPDGGQPPRPRGEHDHVRREHATVLEGHTARDRSGPVRHHPIAEHRQQRGRHPSRVNMPVAGKPGATSRARAETGLPAPQLVPVKGFGLDTGPLEQCAAAKHLGEVVAVHPDQQVPGAAEVDVDAGPLLQAGGEPGPPLQGVEAETQTGALAEPSLSRRREHPGRGMRRTGCGRGVADDHVVARPEELVGTAQPDDAAADHHHAAAAHATWTRSAISFATRGGSDACQTAATTATP